MGNGTWIAFTVFVFAFALALWPEDVAPSNVPKAVLLFDGVCHLCSGFVDFVMRWNANEDVMFASLQSEEGRALLDEVGLSSIAQSLESMVLVELDPHGRPAAAFIRSSAAIRTFARLDPPLPWLYAIGRVIPQPLRDVVYRLVATYRYSVFGQSSTCRVPTKKERKRFLETSEAEECEFLL